MTVYLHHRLLPATAKAGERSLSHQVALSVHLRTQASFYLSVFQQFFQLIQTNKEYEAYSFILREPFVVHCLYLALPVHVSHCSSNWSQLRWCTHWFRYRLNMITM